MKNAQRTVAARYVVAALGATWGLLPMPVRADGGPQLVLPLVAAITAAQMTGSLPGGNRAHAGASRGRLSFLPSQLQIPDVYANLEQDFIEIDRTKPPIDGDRYVWLDLLPSRQQGWMASVAYDEESRGPLAGDNDLLSVVLEYKF